MISTIIMIIIIISSSNSGIIFSFYGFVKLLLMQSPHSCFPRAATVSIILSSLGTFLDLRLQFTPLLS